MRQRVAKTGRRALLGGGAVAVRAARSSVARRAMRPAAVAGVGYLLGTFPTADLVARRAGSTDLRDEGTGNPGAANALKVLGPRAGATVMAGDIAKGVAAGLFGRVAAGPAAAHLGGVAAVAGHCYPIWNGFRGGKGVATSVGQCLVTFPAYFPIDAAVAAGTSAIPAFKERAFTATAVSSAAWVVGGAVWWRRQLPNAWGPRPTALLPIANAVSTAMIMRRFLDGREDAKAAAQ